MSKYVVLYEYVNDEGNSASTVKLFNEIEKAADDITMYVTNIRSDLHWEMISNPYILKNLAPKASRQLIGYVHYPIQEGELPEMITLFKVDEEDPEEVTEDASESEDGTVGTGR